MTTHRADQSPTRHLLSKVPEVTLYFWIVKVLCTTVGESAADFLNVNLDLGLTATSVITGVLLVGALVVQFRADRYIPGRYWLAVTLVSVFGTLVTDNLTESIGVPLETTTLVVAVLLGGTFLVWCRSEKTLSIHSILTVRREAFYWLTILFTFALGTATGDLMAEVLGLGYLVTGVIVAALIAVVAIAWRLGMNPVLSFWFIYILTRPLGASIGDYLAQPASQGGLALGATMTSLLFVIGIIGIVVFLSLTKADVVTGAAVRKADETAQRGGLVQTVLVLVLVLVAAGAGYTLRKAALQDDTPSAAAAAPAGSGGSRPTHASPLGDLSVFRGVTQDTVNLLNSGDQAGATTRVDDLELDWDNAEARLKPRDPAAWTTVDGRIDKVLRELRATGPNPATERVALKDLLTVLV